MSVTIDMCREDPAWSAVRGLEALVGRAVDAAADESGVALPGGCELSCLFCDDATIRALNAQWRGIDAPTNVLSFPVASAGGFGVLLGDLVLAFETVEREAARDEKPLEDHVSHLVVHGFLHLLGHDHEEDAEAAVMEALETRVMARLGLPDPYAPVETDGRPPGAAGAGPFAGDAA